MNTSEKKIRRRTFFKTCGLAVVGMELPQKSLAAEDINETNLQQVNSNQLPDAQLPCVKQHVDYVVVGGGVAGVCSAITAARAGLKVVLIQDRPVLGGNASSEVRLWVLGATSHMGNNNRWAREGGVLDELIVENMYRNKEGNSIFFDALLLEKVWAEPNILLLLNTAVYAVDMDGQDKVRTVIGFCSQNSTRYEISASYFCDASGDGIVGFLAGAAFRIGAEKSEVFGEQFILPDDYGKLLGHSMYFYSKDVGHPVKYVAPAFALKDVEAKIPRYKNIHRDSSGCRLWWLEWGDDLDHVFDSEKIKDELWKVVYGVWDYIKNSGKFENVENLTLEWVSTIPGKRESRRFEGDYILKQQDIVEQKQFEDAIAHGGWAIDLHPGAGVYSNYPGCTQYHSKGVYTIPYRSIYSRNISNLFLGGRLISVSHVAFGSTRVIATGTLCAQAAALAAAICKENNISPREVYSKGFIKKLQMDLMQTGHYIPHIKLENERDLIPESRIVLNETLCLSELPEDGTWRPLKKDIAMLLPFGKRKVPEFIFTVKAEEDTALDFEFYISSRLGNYTPDHCLSQKSYTIKNGISSVRVKFGVSLKEEQYGLVVVKKKEGVSIAQSNVRLTGILSLFQGRIQEKDDKYGFEKIAFYTPERRPGGKNLAFKIIPGLDCFGLSQLQSGVFRPANGSVNAWIAPLSCKTAQLTCHWKSLQTIRQIILWFDLDYDHAMESCLMGHPENIMPFCIQHYKIKDETGHVIYEKMDNHQAKNEICLPNEVRTSSLVVELYQNEPNIPISLFGIQVFN